MNIKKFILFNLLLSLLILPTWAKSSTLTSSTYKKLERAQKELQSSQYQSTIDMLLPVIQKSKKDSLDRAMSWQLIGHAYASQNYYPKAIEAYENALAQNSLHDSLKKSVIVNLGQLYMAEKKYQQGITLLERLIISDKTENNNNSNIHILIANGYYELNQFKVAVPHVKKAIALSKKPEETWHQLLLSLYFELKQFDNSAKQLEKMTLLFPDKKLYWKQLSSIYIQIKQENKALKTLQLAWQKDLLIEEQDIIDLSNLYALQELPFEAATVLQHGLESSIVVSSFKQWDRLSRLYLLAKEQKRAILTMEKAITFSNNGDDHLTLARIYMADEQWKKAQEILEIALTKKSITSKEFEYFYAIVLFEQGEHKKSRELFTHLLDGKKFRSKVKPWVTYLNNK